MCKKSQLKEKDLEKCSEKRDAKECAKWGPGQGGDSQDGRKRKGPIFSLCSLEFEMPHLT